MARKGALAFGAPLASPGLQPIRTDLIHARHLGHTLSRVELAHDGNLQFAGILLSGHKHCSPPFNVIGPLNSCLTFGVQSTVRGFLAYLHANFPRLHKTSQLRRDPHLLGWFRSLCERRPPLRNATREKRLTLLRRLLRDISNNGYPIPSD